VAFRSIGNRSQGYAAYTEKYDGVAYYFSSVGNAKRFKKNPEMFIPQNGGFCTYGVSVGKKFDGDPKFAAVLDEKLYVFLNEDIFNAFQKDVDGTITKAEKKWQKIKHTAAVDL
jgi:YHS domain-containing protein